MATLSFDTPESQITLDIERIVNCGYTGRDEDAVRNHVEELASEGVPAPDTVPTFYAKPHHLLTTDDRIEVMGERTSGEAEFVLIEADGTTYVGVGSDHTDRRLEREDVLLSKLVCQNLLSTDVWPLQGVIDHWDDLELRSWVVDDGEQIPYQEAPLSTIKPPGELRAAVEERLSEPLAGTAVFSGSVATATEDLIPGDRFEAVLYDSVRDRRLECAYDISVVDWLA